jgi:ATP-binding cassette subfamily B protein IrtA
VSTTTTVGAPAAEASASAAGVRGLWNLLRPIRARLLIAFAIQAVGAAASVVPFIAVAQLSRLLLGDGAVSPASVWAWGWVAVGAVVTRLVCVFITGGMTHLADTKMQLTVRRRMAVRLGAAPLGWFTTRGSGAVKKGVSDDVLSMHHLVAHTGLDLVDGAVVPVVSLVYLFSVNSGMALAALLPLLIGFALYGVELSRMRPRMGEYSTTMGDISAKAVEFVQGISVIKTFGQTGRSYRRFVTATDRFLSVMGDIMGGSLKTTAIAETVMAPLTTLVVIGTAGTGFVAAGWIEPVDVIPFVLLGMSITGPLTGLFSAATPTLEAVEASDRVLALLATEALPVSVAPKVPESSAIVFEGVHFSYDGEHAALDGIDLHLEPGTTTALVGRSGSGKTTIAKLIPRFWDPDKGRILLGGVDLREIHADELYRWVTFVFQDVQLLNTSVRDNIRLGRPDATDADVERVAQAAQIHDRIQELPRGYSSVVGEDALFSGGEAQRLSIARALLVDTPVLVLDEATAFADPESEALIQDALSTLAAGRTLLVIAHRLSTIQSADQIVVVDQGRIAERGTHNELVTGEGLYSRLWSDHERASQWRPEVRPEREATR